MGGERLYRECRWLEPRNLPPGMGQGQWRRSRRWRVARLSRTACAPRHLLAGNAVPVRLRVLCGPRSRCRSPASVARSRCAGAEHDIDRDHCHHHHAGDAGHLAARLRGLRGLHAQAGSLKSGLACRSIGASASNRPRVPWGTPLPVALTEPDLLRIARETFIGSLRGHNCQATDFSVSVPGAEGEHHTSW